mgnify:CR=1 FL=1
MATTKKIEFFEWARAFGALAVILLHLFSSQLDNYSVSVIGEWRAVAYTTIQIAFTRWAVPVFLMISGALLLNKSKTLPYKKIWSYILRMLLVLLIFGYAFCITELVFHEKTVSVSIILTAFLNLLQGDSWSHMWYIYALIGLYILTPPLKAFVNASTKRELGIALIVLFIISSLIPTINTAAQIELTTFIELPVYVFYYLFGYYATNYLKLDGKCIGLGVAALFVMLASTTFSIVCNDDSLSWMYANYNCFIALYSSFVFLLFKRLFSRPYENHRFIMLLSRYSFGIYIVHPLFINLIYKLSGLGSMVYTLPFVSELMIYVLTLMLSLTLVWLLKRIPGIKKLL